MNDPRAQNLDRRFMGVAEALVKDNKDPEGQGRVRVTYPWYDEETVSDWCRVCQLYAGSGYGSSFVPEEGDEVLVAFVHGDMHNPVVLGGMYNGKDRPPTQRTAAQDQKTIRTKGGHQLTLDDSAASTGVTIKTSASQSLEMDCKSASAKLTATAITLLGSSIALSSSGGLAPSISLGGTLAADSLLKGTTYRFAESKLNGDVVAALTELAAAINKVATATLPDPLTIKFDNGPHLFLLAAQAKLIMAVISAITLFESGGMLYLSQASKTA